MNKAINFFKYKYVEQTNQNARWDIFQDKIIYIVIDYLGNKRSICSGSVNLLDVTRPTLINRFLSAL